MKYTIEVTRTLIDRVTIEVEAESQEKAEESAVTRAHNDTNLKWSDVPGFPAFYSKCKNPVTGPHLETLRWACEPGGYSDESGANEVVTRDLLRWGYIMVLVSKNVNLGTIHDVWAYIPTDTGREAEREARTTPVSPGRSP
jgi:hypothetical protein